MIHDLIVCGATLFGGGVFVRVVCDISDDYLSHNYGGKAAAGWLLVIGFFGAIIGVLL